MEKPEDDLPPFYIEAAKAVVLMHPFPGDAETGKAIEAVRCAILSAVEEERGQCIAALDMLVLRHGGPGAVAENPYIDLRRAQTAIRNRKGA